MSTSPLSIAAPAVGSFMTQEPTRFTAEAQSAGISFIAMVTNLSIYERRLRTRSRWMERKLESAPDDWASLNTQAVCSYNPILGKTPQNPVSGSAGLIESAGGKLFRYHIGDKTFRVEDISNGIRGISSVRLAWMTQARSYIVRSDEASPTQIFDGTVTTTSTGYNPNAPSSSRLPNFAGPLVFSNRIWITNNRTEVLAGDYANRIDLIGNSDLLKMTEQSLDITSTSFKAPMEMGEITSMNIVTSYRGGNIASQAEILVGTESGLWGILSGTPRAQWANTAMLRIVHPTLAPTGPFASWTANDEMIFRSREGFSTIKYASQEISGVGNPTINIGQEIKPLLDKDPLDLLLFASLYVSQRFQRLICTVWPKVDGLKRWHRGYVSMALSPGRTRVPEAGVWEGVNTLPEKMGEPIQFCEVREAGRIRLFAVLQKSDGTKGLAEWTSVYGDDVLADGTAVKIPWQIHTRKLADSGEMSPSSWGVCYLSITDVRDKVDVEIFARSRVEDDFRRVAETKVVNPTWREEKRGLADAGVICLGAILRDFKDPWVEILIKGQGACMVDFAIKSGSSGQPGETPTVSQCKAGESLCQINYFIRN